MRKVLLSFLAINIFLCYGGLGSFCHDLGAQENSKSNCHSMEMMENEQMPTDNDSNRTLSSFSSSDLMCQYFIVSKTFDIDSDYSYDLSIFSQNFSKFNNYNYIPSKSSLKIPDRAVPTELFIKNSSYLI